jgi:1,2-dihydroxy-3-keto-5-methylthiopentene dioxygenase
MRKLTVFSDNNSQQFISSHAERADIVAALKQVGIRFEYWEPKVPVQPGTAQAEVLEAYKSDIDRLIDEEGYQTVDVVSMTPTHPDKAVFREKFLAEHRHSEDEVRFFVAGAGLFSLHIAEKVYEVLCEKGDLISVPANTPHWFDMGPNPSFVAIRLFNNPDGWVAHFSGSDIASQFTRLAN